MAAPHPLSHALTVVPAVTKPLRVSTQTTQTRVDTKPCIVYVSAAGWIDERQIHRPQITDTHISQTRLKYRTYYSFGLH